MKDEMSEIARQPYAMVVRSGCVALLLWVDVNPPAVAGSFGEIEARQLPAPDFCTISVTSPECLTARTKRCGNVSAFSVRISWVCRPRPGTRQRGQIVKLRLQRLVLLADHPAPSVRRRRMSLKRRSV